MAIISNSKLYDTLKFISLVALPSLNTAWVAIGTIWHLPHVQEIAGTIAALNALLGGLVGVSSIQYKANK